MSVVVSLQGPGTHQPLGVSCLEALFLQRFQSFSVKQKPFEWICVQMGLSGSPLFPQRVSTRLSQPPGLKTPVSSSVCVSVTFVKNQRIICVNFSVLCFISLICLSVFVASAYCFLLKVWRKLAVVLPFCVSSLLGVFIAASASLSVRDLIIFFMSS